MISNLSIVNIDAKFRKVLINLFISQSFLRQKMILFRIPKLVMKYEHLPLFLSVHINWKPSDLVLKFFDPLYFIF